MENDELRIEPLVAGVGLAGAALLAVAADALGPWLSFAAALALACGVGALAGRIAARRETEREAAELRRRAAEAERQQRRAERAVCAERRQVAARARRTERRRTVAR